MGSSPTRPTRTAWSASVRRITFARDLAVSGSELQALAQAAQLEATETVQDILLEDWSRVWPTCAEHDAGLYPDFIDDGGVWLCRRGRHYTPVGELPDRRLNSRVGVDIGS